MVTQPDYVLNKVIGGLMKYIIASLKLWISYDVADEGHCIIVFYLGIHCF